MTDDEEIRERDERAEENMEEGIGSRLRRGIMLVLDALWRWEVVGAIFTIIVGGAAIAAIYGDDFTLAGFLFAVGVLLTTGKALAWEEVRNHKDRMWASLVIVALAVLCLTGCEYWVHYRFIESQKREHVTIAQAANGPIAGGSSEHEGSSVQSLKKDENGSKQPRSKTSTHSIPPKTNVKPPADLELSSVIPQQVPAKQQECQTGSLCNQDSQVNAPQTINNYAPPERALTDEQRTQIANALKGRTIKVSFGYLVTAPDAQQYAGQLCAAVKVAIPSTDCVHIEPWSEGGGGGAHGVEFLFKGDPAPEGTVFNFSPDSPTGMMISAFLAAGIDQGSGSAYPNLPDNEVLILVAKAPGQFKQQ
jgi:hypothetical protein